MPFTRPSGNAVSIRKTSHGLSWSSLCFSLFFRELVSCASLGVDPWQLMADGETNSGAALACLFLSYVIW
jgi:hypothetical protein